MTADPALWAEAVAHGRELLWLHTYAQRFQEPSAKRLDVVPGVIGLAWERPVTKMPEKLADVIYVEVTKTLQIGDGRPEECLGVFRVWNAGGPEVAWLSDRQGRWEGGIVGESVGQNPPGSLAG
jgi:hypothetical protein